MDQSLLGNQNHSWRLGGPSEHQSSPLGLLGVRVEENLERIRDRLALEMFLGLTQTHCGCWPARLGSMIVVARYHVLNHL
jgi:hypothetical protein